MAQDGHASVTKVDDTSDLVAPIVLAFSADPFVRWMMPRSAIFLDVFTEITRLHGEATAAADGAYGRADGRGAAFWYPPGVEPDGEALGAAFERAGAPDAVAAVWEQVHALAPDELHWYLRQIGIEPALQGGGHGSALIEAGLRDADEAGAPAYLEATSARSKRFYERHGFAALGEAQAADSPPLWPMLRRPA